MSPNFGGQRSIEMNRSMLRSMKRVRRKCKENAKKAHNLNKLDKRYREGTHSEQVNLAHCSRTTLSSTAKWRLSFPAKILRVFIWDFASAFCADSLRTIVEHSDEAQFELSFNGEHWIASTEWPALKWRTHSSSTSGFQLVQLDRRLFSLPGH